jgi:hypothetical protein
MLVDSPGATQIVRELLDGINEYKWRNLFVPHGFNVTGLQAAERPSYFPEDAYHYEVRATLLVPVIYDARNGRAWKASRENLDNLHRWIEEACEKSIARLRLVDWVVLPDRDPKPQARQDQDQQWQITATFKFS